MADAGVCHGEKGGEEEEGEEREEKATTGEAWCSRLQATFKSKRLQGRAGRFKVKRALPEPPVARTCYIIIMRLSVSQASRPVAGGGEVSPGPARRMWHKALEDAAPQATSFWEECYGKQPGERKHIPPERRWLRLGVGPYASASAGEEESLGAPSAVACDSVVSPVIRLVTSAMIPPARQSPITGLRLGATAAGRVDAGGDASETTPTLHVNQNNRQRLSTLFAVLAHHHRAGSMGLGGGRRETDSFHTLIQSLPLPLALLNSSSFSRLHLPVPSAAKKTL
ncbi:unnamed protein product [Pleuronectes platessa]|uniref:Uncharacterized protein n=1 Tax=Pleuronectes platessa TaxID=8262 RepID=A0A9N7W125_PLEPL|nr:unnamed protein product [Pleuronectes platessa]